IKAKADLDLAAQLWGPNRDRFDVQPRQLNLKKGQTAEITVTFTPSEVKKTKRAAIQFESKKGDRIGLEVLGKGKKKKEKKEKGVKKIEPDKTEPKEGE
ncbi:MAG: hypothetical protein AAF585_11210, partial [Verrucomicrobiota bacterium]